MKKPSDAYRAVDDGTMPPATALLRAHDRCVGHLTRAIEEMTRADGGSAGEEIRNAHQVIFSLCGALDHEVFPELSRTLEQTYLGLMQALTRAQLRNDVDELQSVADIIGDLRETWVEAIKSVGESPTGEK